ncbi:hypothetical protein [Actinoallomurus acaciae]|uniref:hypothetical protein n=1 Tax=Actinoallomurus acaciae TaxID=502577 RepID=UPI003670A604
MAYLAKQLQVLVKSGVPAAATGPRERGPAAEIRLLQIVEAVDGAAVRVPRDPAAGTRSTAPRGVPEHPRPRPEDGARARGLAALAAPAGAT